MPAIDTSLPSLLEHTTNTTSESLMSLVDLRSDTVTKPSAAMRQAMASAEVGDDVYGEDPTVNLLQDTAAALLGKEAALFVPTGSMANQVSLMAHTRAGDDVIIGQGAHSYFYESGAGGAISHVQFTLIGSTGLFTAADVIPAIKVDNHHYAPTRMVCIENTHNRGGGRVFSIDEVRKIRAVCDQHGLVLHMDGARLFNAAAATGLPAKTWADEVASLSICLSKGLGAPVGSLVLGTKDYIHRCHRYRKMLGGGMRQAGILAAAGLFALQHNIERLVEDHRRARRLAEILCQEPAVSLRLEEVESNIVIFSVQGSAARLAARAREEGVLLNAISASQLRCVTHLDLSDADIERAGTVLARLAAQEHA
jgi:threonine aldolase